MTIDILSLCIGAILWELVSTYFRCFVTPSIKKLINSNKKTKEGNTKTKKSETCENTNGDSNSRLKEES